MSNTKQENSLHPHMTLKDIQQYLQIQTELRGFSNETSQQTMLILLEEVGELAKALRKDTGLKIDTTRISSYGNLGHEMADVLICLFILANKCSIDLFQVFAEKELINTHRTWQHTKPDKNTT